jgi:UDP-N-acetylmuramoyl-L-alanyl-D-glutamate--2,6-diaminopimelate ligase
MKLSQLLLQAKVDFEISGDPSQIEIEDIAIDSRLVKKNSVFFALPGKSKDGLEFIPDAIKNGAVATVAAATLSRGEGGFLITTSNPFSLLTHFLKTFYAPLPTNIYAITGTNGKTSIAEFTRQILEFLGKKSASIGSLGVMMTQRGIQLQNSSLTTPDIVSLYKNLHSLKKSGIDDVAIEVSSIGLEQGRVAGLKIDVGSFTNFTQDHLDYHKSMDDYFKCKMILFERVLENGGENGGVAVLNSDIPEFEKIKKICEEKNLRVIEYGFKARDLRLLGIRDHHVTFEFRQKKYEFELNISGEFQVFNVLCALGNVLAKNDLDEAQLKNLLKNFYLLQPALGRMQRVATLPNRAQIFIDSAHSPDALANVLKLARGLTKSRVIVLFGCGGDRDAGKRPIMGRIACDLADVVIVTDDNPRSEKAEVIRAEIFAACDVAKAAEIADRKVAIEKAITTLKAGDVLIFAGKGHEKYQIIGAEKFEFDEEKIAKDVLTKLS